MSKLFARKTESLFPLGAKVTGFIFLVLGFLGLISGFIPAIILFIGGGFVCFGQSSIKIDFDKNLIRTEWGVFGLKFGKWEKIPELKMVSVTPFSQTYYNNLTMGGAQTESKEHSFRVNLKGKNPRISIVASNGNKKEALRDAELIADKLKLDILDCTEREKKLIKVVGS